MLVATDTIRNGFDTGQLLAARHLIQAEPELAALPVHAANHWVSAARTRSVVGGTLELDTDRPTILLGADSAPTPAAYLLHALAACLTTSIVYVATARGVTLEWVESSITSNLDARAALGIDAALPNDLRHIDIALRIAGDAPERVLREIVEHARQRSAVYNVVAGGAAMSLEVTTRH